MIQQNLATENKIGVFGDIHLGYTLYHNGIVTAHHNMMRDRFFDFAIAELKRRNIHTVLFAGDIFDNRQSLSVEDIHYAIQMFSNKMKDFTIVIIPRNHDMLYENNDSVCGIEMLNFIPNVTVVMSPMEYPVFDGWKWILFPWLGTEETKKTAMAMMKASAKNKADADKNVFFGHFDIMGMNMEGSNISKEGFDPAEIAECCGYVISGHYHCKSITKIGSSKILYLGTPYQMSAAHMGNAPGFYIFNQDMSYEFIENTIGERFIDVNDYDDLDALPQLENTIVRYFCDSTKTAEDSAVLRAKLNDKAPLFVRTVPYGSIIKASAEDTVTIPSDNTEAEKITRMTQLEVAEKFMENAETPPPIIEGIEVKKSIISMIMDYDAS